MKKIILVFAFVLCSLIGSAQIQRTIMGQTLGVSTKKEVYNSLKDRGAFYVNIRGEEQLLVKDVRFGGFSWEIMSFSFYNNILYQVTVMDLDKDSSIISQEEKWNSISQKLESKYHNIISNKEENKISYSDGSTLVMMTKFFDTVSMLYGDMKIIDSKNNKEQNEF